MATKTRRGRYDRYVTWLKVNYPDDPIPSYPAWLKAAEEDTDTETPDDDQESE